MMSSENDYNEKTHSKSPSPQPFIEPKGMVDVNLSQNEQCNANCKVAYNQWLEICRFVFSIVGILLALSLLIYMIMSSLTQPEYLNNNAKNLKYNENGHDNYEICSYMKSIQDCCRILIQNNLFEDLTACEITFKDSNLQRIKRDERYIPDYEDRPTYNEHFQPIFEQSYQRDQQLDQPPYPDQNFGYAFGERSDQGPVQRIDDFENTKIVGNPEPQTNVHGTEFKHENPYFNEPQDFPQSPQFTRYIETNKKPELKPPENVPYRTITMDTKDPYSQAPSKVSRNKNNPPQSRKNKTSTHPKFKKKNNSQMMNPLQKNYNTISNTTFKNHEQMKKSTEVNIPTTNENVENKLRISQGNDFDIKSKNDPFATVTVEQSSQSRLTNPCVLMYPQFGQPLRNNDPLMPIMSVGSPQQPLYVVNPSMYGGMQYHGYQSPMVNPYFYQFNSVVRNPIQVTGPGGQYYVCNPISSGSTGAITGIPGVEIRQNTNDDFTLQKTMQSMSRNFSNNRTRESISCPKGQRSCLDGSKCISNLHFCDNVIHCMDGSDEMLCTCKDRVGESRLCDGFFDCPGGEDERGCFDCSETEFSCDNWSRFRKGTCVSIHQRCDGIRDCEVTGKDEEDCSVLIDHVGTHGMYTVSNAVGFLHRNYKGKWYPACIGSDLWALDVCRTESGPSEMLPKSMMVMVNNEYNGRYSTLLGGKGIRLTDTCLDDRVTFVECPPLFCGLRMMIRNPFRHSEIDTSAEDMLNNIKRTTSEEILGISRVVGGKASQPAAWPWVVSIYKNGIFHCGGVLINELWVVTAAHCVDKFWFFYYEIEVGMLRRFSYSPMEQNRFASAALPHEGYNKRTLKNDIALMKLSSPVRFNRYVRPICLPSEATAGREFHKGPPAGTICTTVGWGATVEHGTDPDHIREVEIPVLSRCKHIEDEEGDEICAGLREGGRDACQGDSGGPLMCRNVNNPSQWYLAGIVSHGEGCARPNEPGVYTKVSKYLGWLAENIRDHRITGRVPLSHCPGYVCTGTKKCLPKKRHCDKIVDCLLGDDEFNCWQSKPSHSIFERVGSTHMNILTDFFNLLDLNTIHNKSEEIMEDNSVIITTAEPPSTTKNETRKFVTPNIFRCKILLQVVPFSKRCDKFWDCEDGTDEQNCDCVDYLKHLHDDAICDGVGDCKDLSDESDCIERCSTEEYFCRSSQSCIPMKSRCDGIPDCADDEDEWDCVVLTDGKTLVLDSDLRPRQSMKGIITINRFGVWRLLCTNASDNAASIAANVCNLLGFEEYTAFHKLSVEDKLVNVTIDGFERNHHLNTSNGTACGGLYVGCSSVGTSNVHRVYQDNITNPSELYTLPWSSVIYVDGKLRCTGAILNSEWIVASAGCLRGLSLKTNYIAALLGVGKTDIPEEGPHEQTIPIHKLELIEGTDVIILGSKEKINFTRYIRPVPLTTRTTFTSEKCVAIGIQNERVVSVFLKSMAKCPPRYMCFEKVKNPQFCQHFQTWTGVITCLSRDAWYPAAVFTNDESVCNSINVTKFLSITLYKTKIEDAIKTPYERASLASCLGFRCKLGQCLENTTICNSIPDCRSGEDENFEFCTENVSQCHLTNTCACKLTEFRCTSGKCISKSSFCDGINDCEDYSDEPTVCSCSAYLKLTHPEKICDGTVNCFDKSDEDPSKCGCASLEVVRCGRTNSCVSNEMICDGIKDCPNGEDESICYSLRTNLSRYHSGEVMTRTSGIWHSGCFTRNHTISELEKICERLGFTGGSGRQLTPPEGSNSVTVMKPSVDTFNVVWIRRTKGNRLKFKIRTGNEPYVRFQEDLTCHKLYLECL